MDFGKRQLERYGWKKGTGLGKRRNGMKEAIKVNLKRDTTGVGHDKGKEFKIHWWDHLYNSTANKIEVDNDETAVSIKKSSIKETKNTYASKELLYGRFRKSGTLVDGGMKKSDKKSDSSDSSSSDDSDEDLEMKCVKESTFELCKRRTAHPGGRFGIRMTGKLKRLEMQESSPKPKKKKK